MNKHTSTGRRPGFARRALSGLGRAGAVKAAGLFLLLAVCAVGTVEFALVLVDFQRAGEATHRAIRSAQASAPIASLAGLAAGPVVCGGASGRVSCSGGAVVAPDSFAAIVESMRDVMPGIGPENVRVRYRASRLGGEATANAAAPVVSVDIINLTHRYRLWQALPGMPAEFSYPRLTTSALVAADAAGEESDGF